MPELLLVIFLAASIFSSDKSEEVDLGRRCLACSLGHRRSFIGAPTPIEATAWPRLQRLATRAAPSGERQMDVSRRAGISPNSLRHDLAKRGQQFACSRSMRVDFAGRASIAPGQRSVLCDGAGGRHGGGNGASRRRETGGYRPQCLAVASGYGRRLHR